jgi:hypothetical protein
MAALLYLDRMKRLTLAFLFSLLLSIPCIACLNEYRNANTEALKLPLRQLNDSMIRHFDHGTITLELQTRLQAGLWNFRDSSDAAVLMIKAGEVFHALAILRENFRTHPGEYTIAANLGTAYELAGENDSALKYIRRGMQLNPQSHNGSEWVHERILKTKISLSGDPDWLSTHTVLDLSHHMFREEMNYTGELKRGNAQVDTIRAIIYQLKERIPFTSAPDLIMCSITNDLAEITRLGTTPLSLRYFTLADEYAGGKNPKIRESLESMRASKESGHRRDYWFAGIQPLEKFSSVNAYRVTDGIPAQHFEIATQPDEIAVMDAYWQFRHPKKKPAPIQKRSYTLWALGGILLCCTVVLAAIKLKSGN